MEVCVIIDERRETRDERRETTAAIKPRAEAACRLCRGVAVKSRACTGQRRETRDERERKFCAKRGSELAAYLAYVRSSLSEDL
uniref:hypothetical protein n=1 Tax=Alistipes sp. TaxID=1872444 RepID=UPI0040576E82